MVYPRLRRLTLQGFRSFVEPASIEFPTSGNVLLNGRNLDTGGSSGSGKSSIAAAIAMALGFSPFSATDLQTWHPGATCSVSLELETATGLVVITRGKKTTLTVDGTRIPGSSRQIDEQLKNLLGLAPDLMSLLTYRGQRKSGLFLGMTDLEKKDFLTKLLGLDIFETACDESAVAVRSLDVTIELRRAVVERLGAELVPYRDQPTPITLAIAAAAAATKELEDGRAMKKDLEASIVRAEEHALALAQAAVRAFDGPLASAQALVATIPLVFAPTPPDRQALLRLTDLASAAQERLARALSADVDRQTDLNKYRADLNLHIQNLALAIGRLDGLAIERVRLAHELVLLDTNVCPTCERQWDSASEERARLIVEVAAIDARVAALQNTRDDIGSATQTLQDLPPFEPAPVVEQLRAVCSQLQEKISAEEQRIALEDAVSRGEHRRLRAEAHGAVDRIVLAAATAGAVAKQEALAHITGLRVQVGRLDLQELFEAAVVADQVVAEAASAHATWGSLNQQLASAIDALHMAEREQGAEKDFQDLIGRNGFLGSVFDEVLAEISDETNRILASVANTRHCTLHFTSEILTQKGTVQKRITPLITVGEHSASFSSGLSGGMQSVVELATDLAVGAVISRRSGACPGWLLLDECFEGLGAVEKESCIDILQTYAQERLVLVVDHGSEFKAIFQHSIDIDFAQGKSYLRKVEP